MGDFRATINEFADQMVIEKMRANKEKLEKRFSNHPQPVMHGVVDALLTDVETGCVLLGQRNVAQVKAAAQLGSALPETDANWVKNLYKE